MAMLMTRRDPFAEFDAIVRRAFPTRTAVAARAGFTPAAEISRDGDDALVALELPGLDLAKDISVELDGTSLVVSGERRDERTENDSENGGRFLREIRYGSFKRTFTLPEHVTADALSASYDAGVLTVRVAGAYAGTEPRKITVTAGPTPVAVDAASDDPASDAAVDAVEPTES